MEENNQDKKRFKALPYECMSDFSTTLATGQKLFALRNILEKTPVGKDGSLMIPIGLDQEGNYVFEDLCELQDILIGGSTGTGKTVFLHDIIISLMMQYTPEEVKLLLFDPKAIELGCYSGCPHLLADVISEPTAVLNALDWVIKEMQRRIDLCDQKRREGKTIENIGDYNAAVKEEEKLPAIVVIADEIADYIEITKGDFDFKAAILAMLGSKVGIHLIFTTQCNSALTKLLLEKFPTHFTFRTETGEPNFFLLGSSLATDLQGRGDALYIKPNRGLPDRVQTPWIDVPEIDTLCDGFRSLNDQNYDQSLLEALQKPREEKKSEELEPVYIEALRYAVLEGKISISAIQRKCVISFNKAGRIIDWMEENGYITPFDKMTPAPRKVLLTKEKFIEKYGDL